MAFRQTQVFRAPTPIREIRRRKHYGGKIFTALLVVAAIVFGAYYTFGRTPDVKTITADFSFVNGLYNGSKVTVLGVPVGRVTAVDPKGDHVRVTFTVPGDVKIPADVQAYIFNPSVISDRHLDLSPAYTKGAQLPDAAAIPLARTHSPISWDQLMDSVGTLTGMLGTDSTPTGNLGNLLATTASSWDGRGEQFGQVMTSLASATSIFGVRSDEIGSLITSLSTLTQTFAAKQVSLDGLVNSLGALSAQWKGANSDLSGPMRDLQVVFDQVNDFVMTHGNDVGVVAKNLEELGKTLAANKSGLAEFMDLAPLMMQNLSSTIGPDRRGRIRLNVSTTLTQFKTLKPLCDRFPMPLCVGAGLTNPIAFPISQSDPLGIVSAITGGRLPATPAPPGATAPNMRKPGGN